MEKGNIIFVNEFGTGAILGILDYIENGAAYIKSAIHFYVQSEPDTTVPKLCTRKDASLQSTCSAPVSRARRASCYEVLQYNKLRKSSVGGESNA